MNFNRNEKERIRGAVNSLLNELKRLDALAWSKGRYNLLRDALLSKSYMPSNTMLGNAKAFLMKQTKNPSVADLVNAIYQKSKAVREEAKDHMADPEVKEFMEKVRSFEHERRDEVSQILFDMNYQELGSAITKKATVIKIIEERAKDEEVREIRNFMYNAQVDEMTAFGVWLIHHGRTL